LIRDLRYYGPGDYPFITFLALPFRCGPSPVIAESPGSSPVSIRLP